MGGDTDLVATFSLHRLMISLRLPAMNSWSMATHSSADISPKPSFRLFKRGQPAHRTAGGDASADPSRYFTNTTSLRCSLYTSSSAIERITTQIDALEANAIDAFKFLAVTRIIALMIAMPLLTIMMDFAGIFGGYVAEAAVSGMSWQLYFARAFSFIGYSDIIPATLKTIMFGYLIAVVSSYLGFTTSRGTEGVGDASTRSVVMSSILIILSDVILVKIIFFFYPAVSG
jgi:hypothetical protein